MFIQHYRFNVPTKITLSTFNEASFFFFPSPQSEFSLCFDKRRFLRFKILDAFPKHSFKEKFFLYYRLPTKYGNQNCEIQGLLFFPQQLVRILTFSSFNKEKRNSFYRLFLSFHENFGKFRRNKKNTVIFLSVTAISARIRKKYSAGFILHVLLRPSMKRNSPKLNFS